MPRNARIVIPHIAHHITQRGNNKQDVFFIDDDREKFLYLLSEQAKRFGVIIEGFCLMTNHIHIIATPTMQESLAKALGTDKFISKLETVIDRRLRALPVGRPKKKVKRKIN